jgi:hypothetical protein
LPFQVRKRGHSSKKPSLWFQSLCSHHNTICCYNLLYFVFWRYRGLNSGLCFLLGKWPST